VRVVRRSLVAAVAVLVVGLWLARVWAPIDPLAWTPPAPPEMTGVLAANQALSATQTVALGPRAHGPEDTAHFADGAVVTGLEDGRLILRTTAGAVTELAWLPGRPLGVAAATDATVWVAVAGAGLMRVARTGRVERRLSRVDGVPLAFADDVDLGPDGTVYVSDASTRHTLHAYEHDILSSRPNGRLIAYEPALDRARTVGDALYFANGVAVSHGGASVLVTESGRYRIQRIFVAGARAGEREPFAENLPGIPDGIARGRKAGTYWVALFSPRDAVLDWLHPHPHLKAWMTWLPAAWAPQPQRYGLVACLDRDGRIVGTLHAPDGGTGNITSVEPDAAGRLWLGNLTERSLYRVPAPAAQNCFAPASQDAPVQEEE